ncbi:MAG: hypothetical protein QOD84_2122 [Acidobacteriaceae bacterium]|jgi:hypothetical protein
MTPLITYYIEKQPRGEKIDLENCTQRYMKCYQMPAAPWDSRTVPRLNQSGEPNTVRAVGGKKTWVYKARQNSQVWRVGAPIGWVALPFAFFAKLGGSECSSRQHDVG